MKLWEKHQVKGVIFAILSKVTPLTAVFDFILSFAP